MEAKVIQGVFGPAGPKTFTSSGTMTAASKRLVAQPYRPAGVLPVDPALAGLMNGRGRPLPDPVRISMEAALGADFSNVRVHDGPQAEKIGAIAFTVGSDIYFAPGRFQPETLQGKQLLGHELAHVIQQRQGRVRNPIGSGMAIVQDRVLETEADRLGQIASTYRNAAGPRVAANPIQAKLTSAAYPAHGTVQAKLGRVDTQQLDRFLMDTIRQILTGMARQGRRIIPQDMGKLVEQIRRVRATARQKPNLIEARAYVIDQAEMAIHNARIEPVLRPGPADQAFSLFQSRNQPPRDQLERSGILPDAMMATSTTPTYGSSPSPVPAWLRDPNFHLRLFRRLHRTVERVLWFANLSQGPDLPLTLSLSTGHDLLGTVGRLSMMIEECDFLPTWDTRSLPMNWTQSKFIDARAKVFHYGKKNLKAIKQSVEGSPAFNAQIATSSSHQIRLRTSDRGALRLDFSDARRILQQVSPGSTEEDLSYENIVAYLSRQSGAALNTQVRQAYSTPLGSDPFVRELLTLLVGVEGTQNNVMALHAPMVTDLVGQGTLTWSQALFTGQRSTDLGSIPWFAYAADKNQKGSSDRSLGPMERQTSLLRSGRFDREAARLDNQRVNNEEKRARLQAFVEEKLIAWGTEIALKVEELAKAKYKKKLEYAKEPEAIRKLKEEMQIEATNSFRQKASQDWERKNGKIPAPERREPQSGYLVFQHSYMARQFQLQQTFLETMFPQVLVLDFSSEGQFLEFAERLVERYLFHRFYGEQWRRMSRSLDSNRNNIDKLRHNHYLPQDKFL